MANQFAIQPAVPLAGFQALTQGISSRAQFEREKAAEAEQQQKLQEGARILQEGTTDEIMSFMVENPWAGEHIDRAYNFKNEATKQNAIDTAWKTRQAIDSGQSAVPSLIERSEFVIGQNGDASGTMQLAEQTQDDPSQEAASREADIVLARYDREALESYYKRQEPDKAGMEVAGIKEFEYLTEGLPEEEKAAARRIKLGLSPRATETAAVKAEKQFATESAKLQARYDLEPRVAGAVQAAKNQATAEVKEVGKAKSDESAWNVYDGAMSNLAQAMAGTETGPAVGFIPAVTANAQIAEGAVAVMAPVLKSMFRSSGEGTFTDKDQEMLLKMVPTRKDHPGARSAKIAAIDAIVRAKLNKTEDEPRPPTITSQAAYDNLPSGTVYIEDGQRYRKP